MTLRKVQAEQLDLTSPNSEQFTTGGAEDLSLNDKLVISDVSDGDKSKVATLQQLTSLVGDNISGPLNYQGTWNAATDVITPGGGPRPTAGPSNKGWYYIVTAAGAGYNIGDWTVSNGTSWDKIDNTDAVTSVNGFTGPVVLTYSDVGAAASSHAHDWSDITSGLPTTLAGYGITDATPSSHIGSGGAAHADATPSISGFMSATDKAKLDAITGTNTGDQTITLTGDVTGSGTGSFATTLSNSGVTAGTYQSVTVDAKGRVTGGTNPAVPYAPSDATYIVLSSNSDLSGERTLALTANQLSGSDGGSGNPYTVSIANNPILPGTGSVTVPTGTSAQEPVSPTNGMVRYDSTANRYRVYENNVWKSLSGVLSKSTTSTTFTGTTTENALIDYTIPANALETDTLLKLRIGGTLTSNTNGTTWTARVRYGGTILYQDASATLASGNTIGFHVDLVFTSDNSTSAQKVTGRIQFDSIGAATTGGGDLSKGTSHSSTVLYGSSAEPSTTAKALQVTFTSNNANHSISRYYSIVEKY